jgi:hypothetical protein
LRLGGVKRLAFEDGYLTPYAGELQSDLLDWLRSGAARYFSASFYLPEHPNNPVPGVLYLRHVGVVRVPAIKGQPEPELIYSESGKAVTVNFSEYEALAMSETNTAPAGKAGQPIPPPAQPSADFAEQQRELTAARAALESERAALEKERTELRRAEIVSFAEGLEKSGKILPRQKAGMVEFLAAQAPAAQACVLEFAEGPEVKKFPADAWLRGFLAELPPQVEFAEVSKPGDKKPPVVDPTEDQLMQRLKDKEKQKEKGVKK